MSRASMRIHGVPHHQNDVWVQGVDRRRRIFGRAPSNRATLCPQRKQCRKVARRDATAVCSHWRCAQRVTGFWGGRIAREAQQAPARHPSFDEDRLRSCFREQLWKRCKTGWSVWLKNANCLQVMRGWSTALSDANNLANGACGLSDGSKAGDWRLPNRNELASLLDLNKRNPALPARHPFTNFQAARYWSSTANSPGSVWRVDFLDAAVTDGTIANFWFATFVRDGP